MLTVILWFVAFYAVIQAFLHRRILYICIKTLPRDIHASWILVNFYFFLSYIKYTNQTAARYFDGQMKKRRGKPCFYFEDEVWTYDQVQELSYKIGNYFQSLGFKKGETVALLMENRPDYICTWLGLSRIGVVSGLINFNIRLKSLEHCVAVVNPKCIIYGSEMTPAIQQVIDSGGFKNLDFYCLEDRNPVYTPLIGRPFTNLTKELESTSTSPTTCDEKLHGDDTILMLFTSGTTGLPKASIVKQSRIFTMSSCAVTAGLKSRRDILITPVPLYHAAGGVLGVTAAIFHGVPQVILKKFSASQYWSQCIKYNATASQYVGEIIRCLYNQPPDDNHKVTTFFGNGVNPTIWRKFVNRFKNVKIKEVYGATESNCHQMNIEGHVGACGHFPVWAFNFLPYFFAKVDESGELVRDQNGFAIKCRVGEPGEMLGKISSHPLFQSDGYTDKNATIKKIATNVRAKGDSWFRSGDLLSMDEWGYLHFKDRMGDTFKCKGENVSTTEVEQVITQIDGIKGCVVYGVEVPGLEGRVGMATISDPEGNLDFQKLATEVNLKLPSYARPLFLRVLHKEMIMTGTFKLRKVDLRREGFNIEMIKDPIYILKNEKYIILSKELHQHVISGRFRL